MDCPTHGVVEDNSQLNSGNVTISFVGSTMRCPICGERSPVIDGDYELRGTSLDARLRPTPAQLRHLQNAVAWAQQRVQEAPDTAEEVAAKLRKTVDRHAPELGRAVTAAAVTTGSRSQNALTWVLGVAAVVQALLAVPAAINALQPSLSPADIVRIVREVERDAKQSTPLPPEPTTPVLPPRPTE